MPIGEDIPLLIPISIVLVVFVIFLVSLFSNQIEQTEIIEMSQEASVAGNFILNSFSDIEGNLDTSKLNGYCEYLCSIGDCCRLKYLNYYSNYETKITIEANGDCWCWDNNAYFSEQKVTSTFPIQVKDGNNQFLGQVIVNVGK